MDLFLRFTLYVSLLLGVVVGVGYTQPKWIADLGLDFWNLLELEQLMAESNERSAQLDKEREKVIEKSERKQQLVRQLIDQQISLVQAARQIQKIEDDSTLEVGLGVLGITGKTQEERVCKALVLWAERQFLKQPEQAAQVRAQLESELQNYLATVQ